MKLVILDNRDNGNLLEIENDFVPSVGDEFFITKPEIIVGKVVARQFYNDEYGTKIYIYVELDGQ